VKRLFISTIAALLLLSGCSLLPAQNVDIALGDIPYTWKISKDLASHLSVETPDNEYSSQAKEFGAQAQAIVYYTPVDGERVNFMGVYYFPTNSYLAATRADEPPPFGSKIIESNGMILSAWGPQDSIYEPDTQDGKNISALYKYVYDAGSFIPTNTWKTKTGAPVNLVFPSDNMAMFPLTELWRSRWPNWSGTWVDLPTGQYVTMTLHGYNFLA